MTDKNPILRMTLKVNIFEFIILIFHIISVKSGELFESQLAYPKIDEVKIKEDKLIEDKSRGIINSLICLGN